MLAVGHGVRDPNVASASSQSDMALRTDSGNDSMQESDFRVNAKAFKS